MKFTAPAVPSPALPAVTGLSARPAATSRAAAPRPTKAVPSRVKRRVQRRRPRVSRLLAWLLAAWLGPMGVSLAQLAPGTLPSGGHVVVGSGVLQHNPNLLVIQQNSQKLGLDWQSFNIGSAATVEFRQPNAGSVALNRVLGNSGTEIYGQLRANGQVFLTNPNGVLFAPGAKVDVGGLVASTLDLSQQDFADGRYVFNHTGGRGAVVNQGSLTASAGGYLVLFGNQVSNQGDIAVDAGSVVLASGRAATVSISGSGLLSAVVTPGALDGRVDNSGRISADGGVVTLTAKSAQDIAASLVNNNGIVRANTLVEKAGEIWITGDRVSSSGTLAAAAPAGGDAGRIVVKGDLQTGSLQLDGRIDATSALGRGGEVETSAAHVAIARSTRVDSRGAAATGTWLIDPTDFTVAAGGAAQTTSGIGADTLSTNLATTSVTLQTAPSGSEPGDIHVNAAVAWSANTTLTLQATRDINFNASVTATGAGAALVLTHGAGRFVNVNATDSSRPTVSLSGVNASLTINNLGYTLVRDLAGLQAMNSGLAGRYALMADIDASSTAANGFVPIGNETSATITGTGAFTGIFDGMGHRISGLTINRPASNATGLFASTSAATLRNFELFGGAVSGSQFVGAVAGYTRGATTLHNIRSSASVTALDDASAGVWAGGLVGQIEGSSAGGVLRSVASGAVTATGNTSIAYAGGLVAEMDAGLLTEVSARGNVTLALASGTNDVSHHAGGLVGHYSGGNITTASATGNVLGGHESGGLLGRFLPTSSSTLTLATASGNVTGTGNVGGLVGHASGSGAITSSSATGSVSTSTPEAQSYHAGGAVGRYGMTGAPSALSAAGNVSGGNTTGGVVGWIDSNVALISGSLVSAAPGGGALKTVTGPRWVGGLIGYSDSSSAFSGLMSEAVVTATNNQGAVGGLIGRSNGALNSSSSSGSVSGTGSDIGGLVGRAQGAGGMNAVSSAATVTSSGTGGAAGGLVGAYSNSGSIVTGSASGAVQGPSGSGGITGGLIGSFNSAGSLSTVSTAVTSTVSGGGDVGGLIGQATGSGSAAISGAIVRGTVAGAANTGYVGGLVGQFSLPGGWSNVTVDAAVTGGSFSGGLAGYYNSAAAITNGSYTPAAISGGTWVGGVVGYMASTAAITGAAANNPWVITTQVTATAMGGGAGGLAGRTAGAVSHITTSGAINGADEAGGVIGRADGSGGLNNLRASGNVSSSSGTAAVGGVAGYVTNTGGVSNATATGSVSGGRYTGGVIGQYSANGNLQTLRGEGNVSGTGDAGGVVGYANGSGMLTDADALGSVTSSDRSFYSAGGTVGYFGLTGGLSDITAAGNVSGGAYTGGVVGYHAPSTAIAAGALGYVNSASRSVTGSTWVGGLVGYSNSSAIAAHSVAAAVTHTGTSGAAGGLAGRTGGTLSNSSASGSVVSGATAGGLVGQADGTATFTDVSASGAVRGTTNAGGLVGVYTSSATLLRGTASGAVFTNGTGGGLVGYHYGGTISSSSATGNVTGVSDSEVSVGGLVGAYGANCFFSCALPSSYLISGSQASGAVTADASSSHAGGLVGIVYSAAISNSNASGAVSSRDTVNSSNGDEFTGGLVGRFGLYNTQGSITGSNATGAVSGGYYNGGLVGYYNGGAVTNSTATGSVSNGRETGGLMGYATLYGPMSNVSASGAVTSTSSTASGPAGGLLGWVYLLGDQTTGGSITNASASGAVTVSRTSGDVGGLIGYLVSSGNSTVGPINDSRASGAVSGGGSTGGLIGRVDNSGGYSAVLNSHATGSVTGNSTVGGLIGNYSRTTSTGRADDITNSYATGQVIGNNYLGGLVGQFDGRYGIAGSYASGDVVARDATGFKYMGGLVGDFYGRHTSASVVSAITTSYATGEVRLGSNPVITSFTDVYAGGLVGYLRGTTLAVNGIIDAYATGAVTLASTQGRLYAGGLVGFAVSGQGGLRSHASGAVSATGGNSRATGGLLAGRNNTNATFTDSYWNSTTTGQSASVGGGTARTTAEMQQASTFGGWNLATTGAGGTVWRIYEGYTAPLLSRFLTPRTLSLADASKTYDGTRSFGNAALTALNGSINFPERIFVAMPSADVGSYSIAAADVYSVQNGYDLTVTGSATLGITRRAITLAGLVADKVYDGTRTATLLGTAQPSGVVSGEALTVNTAGATAVFDTKNVGQGKAVTITGLSLADGANGKASNYLLADASASSANVTPATLNAGGFTATNRAYDGSTTVAVTAAGGTVSGIFGSDDVTVGLGGVSSGSIADKNVGIAKPVSILGATLGGADAGNYVIGGLDSTTVDITPRALTVNGLVASNRTYNQGLTVTVPVANAVVSGAVAGDVLQLRNISVTGTMADRHAGDGKAVTIPGSSLQLRGPDAGNYTVADATSTVNIARAQLSFAADYFGTSNDKVYDGTDAASGITPYFYSNVTGYLFAGTTTAGPDTLTLSHDGPRYSDKNVAYTGTTVTSKTITVANAALSLVGEGAGNYTLVNNTATTSGRITPRSLTVSGVSATNRAYDGSVNVNVNVTGATVDTTAVVPGDTVTVTVPGAGTVVGTVLNKNVGTAKPVTVPGFSLGGGDAGNYSLSGNAGVTVDITRKPLTAVYTALDKIYDGNAYAPMSVASPDAVAGDSLFFYADTAQYGCYGCYSFFVTGTSTPTSYTQSRDAGNNKRVVVSFNGLFGSDAGNYTLLNPTATLAASITPKGITPVFTGVERAYDGTTAATVTVNTNASGIVSGDAVSLTRNASFADRNAGTGKTVTITDIAFTGAAASNYTLTANTATTTATITPKTLGVAGVTATDRFYDGGTTVALTVGTLGASGLVGNDVVTVNAPAGGITTGTVANKAAAPNKAVTVAGLTLSGADAANYSLSGSQGVTVNITPRPLTVSYTGQTREYNGGVSASVVASSADIVPGDVLSFTQNAIFTGLDGRNVDINKPISVTSIVPGGADSSNYVLQNTTATTTGTITAKPITVIYTGLSRVYNGLADTSANVTGLSFGLIAGDQVSFAQTAIFTGNGSAGLGKPVAVSDIRLEGLQRANYSVINTTATTTATVTQRPLGVTGVVAANRVYDGTTVVQLSTVGATVLPSGVLPGDDVGIVLPSGGITTGTLATKDAGNNRPVSITGLTLSGTSAANYSVGGNGLTVNITPRPLTAIYTAAERVYDGTTLASISGSSADILAGDAGALGIGATGLFSAGKAAGINKAVTVSGGFLSGAERNNYSLVNTTGLTTATITRRFLTAAYTGGTRVYDGEVNAPVVATGSGVLQGDVVGFVQTAVFTGANAKDVGSGKAIAISGIDLNGADAANYQLTGTTASVTGNAGGTITPKSISIDGITGASATNRVYDGTREVQVTVSTSGTVSPSSADIVSGDDVTINLPAGGITTGSMLNKNAGDNKAVVIDGLSLSGNDRNNYVVAATTGITVNIARKTVTAVYSGVDRVYDGSTTATGTGTSIDLLPGDAVTIAATGVFTGVGARNVGTAKPVSLLSGRLVGSVTDIGNYALINTTGNTTATITRKLLDPSYTALPKVYDGTTDAVVQADTSGLISGDAVQFGQTAVFTGNRNVGTNKAIAVSNITLSGSDAANYDLITTVAATSGSITPRPLRIDGLTGVTATDRVYDGTRTVSVVVSASGPIAPNPQDLIAGDVVTVNVPSTGTTTGTLLDKNVGSAKPVAVAGLDLSGADAANYSIAATSGVTVNITPRPLTAIYTAAAREYDGSTAARIVGTSTDILADDLLSIVGSGVFSGAGGKNAGTAKPIDIVSVSFEGADAANYNLLNRTGTATGTITPRNLVVTYLGGTRVYDGTVLAPVTGTADRFVAGDDIRLTQTALFTGGGARNAGTDKAVSITAIGLDGADAANYRVNIGSASTTATVTQRPLRIEGFTGVVASDRVYDGTTAVAITATGSGAISANPADLIAGDDIAVVAPATGTTAGAMADKNVGSNKPVTVSGITLSGADAGNYRVAAASGVTVNITPKPLTATYAGHSRVYDGTATVTITGGSADIVSGDLVSITGSGLFTGADAKNVGAGKAISITGGMLGSTDALNYSLVNTSGTATASITPKTLVASYTGGTRVYDGSTTAPVTGVLDGLIAGDDLGVSQTAVFTGGGARNVGDGKAVLVSGITLSGRDAANYSLLADTVSTVGTITPRPLNVGGLSGLQAVDRVYDGTRDVQVTGSLVAGTATIDVVPGDAVSVNLPSGNVSAGRMVDKAAGTAKGVVLSGLSLSGADAANYALVGTAGLTVNIAPRPVLLLGVSAQDRVYDGSVLVAINSSGGSLSGVLAGDDLQLRSSGVTGTVGDKNVGSAKAVTVSGLSFEGADLGNYTVSGAGSGLVVNITPRTLLASVAAADKIYNGNANAVVTIGSDALTSDSLSLTAASTLFASANAGNGLTVTASGLTLAGADAGNYSLAATTLTTTASILRRPLTVAANTLSKIYGDTFSLPSDSFSIDGLVQGESLGTVVLASAGTAAAANAGAYTLSIGGASGGSFNPDNYVLTYVNGSLNVTPRPLTIAANSVVRFADQANPGNLGYSTSVGGLTGGDSLASVLVSAPPASVGAPAVSVFDLLPSGAVFGSGTASNYAITYARGVLLVLPTPPRVDDVNAGGEPSGNTGFAVQVDAAEVERALGALTRNANVVAQARVEDNAVGTELLPPGREATAAAIAVLLSGDGGRVTLPDLKRMPLISFEPGLRRLLTGEPAQVTAPATAPATAPGASRPAP